jgi:hypothetical protein
MRYSAASFAPAACLSGNNNRPADADRGALVNLAVFLGYNAAAEGEYAEKDRGLSEGRSAA